MKLLAFDILITLAMAGFYSCFCRFGSLAAVLSAGIYLCITGMLLRHKAMQKRRKAAQRRRRLQCSAHSLERALSEA